MRIPKIIYKGLAIFILRAALATCSDVMVKKPAQPSVCPCEYNFDPVCGTDGLTYTNECLLQCYSSNAVRNGKPPVTSSTDGVTCLECVCQHILLPVCTIDGYTYPNECELSCEINRRLKLNEPLVYLAYRAACLGPPCICSTIASPVCGSDNILYRNICELNCAGANAKARGSPVIELKNVGACLDGCLCPDVNEPVCGTDGNQYKNLCEISCANRRHTCSLSTPVEPAPTMSCQPCTCPSVYNPVCGSDGKLKPRTFTNVCQLKCEAKRTNNPYLNVIKIGVCPTCFCNGQHLPVCGTDCKTYTNECELRCANDRRGKGDPLISVFHTGGCGVLDCDCSHCDMEYGPVCGDDDVTYWNSCWLDCNSGCSSLQDGQQILLASKGSCNI